MTCINRWHGSANPIRPRFPRHRRRPRPRRASELEAGAVERRPPPSSANWSRRPSATRSPRPDPRRRDDPRRTARPRDSRPGRGRAAAVELAAVAAPDWNFEVGRSRLPEMVETPAEAAARTRRSRARSQARRDEEAAAALHLAAEAEADENRAERMLLCWPPRSVRHPAAAKPGPKRTPALPDQGASMTARTSPEANEAAIAKAVERGAVPIAEAGAGAKARRPAPTCDPPWPLSPTTRR